jgi:hypothetical protein
MQSLFDILLNFLKPAVGILQAMSKAKVWSSGSLPFPLIMHGVSELTKSAKQKSQELGSIPQLELDNVGFAESIGIRHALVTAGICYCAGLNDACIVFSSIAAECVLNWDYRLEAEKSLKQYRWLDVDNRNLKLANDSGLPVNELLFDGETIQDLGTPNQPVRFVKLRNKYVHGEYAAVDSIARGTPFGESLTMEELAQEQQYPTFIYVSGSDAFNQFKHASNFITCWAAQSPEIVISES